MSVNDSSVAEAGCRRLAAMPFQSCFIGRMGSGGKIFKSFFDAVAGAQHHRIAYLARKKSQSHLRTPNYHHAAW